MNNTGKIFQESTILFVCDMQTYYLDKVDKIGNIVVNNKCLMTACKELDIPIIMTKHNPSQYGEIIKDLNTENENVFSKTLYSMYNSQVKEYFEKNSNSRGYPRFNSVILTGLETHVCLVQTAQDLIANGFIVHVVVDAISSINSEEGKWGLKRLKAMNVVLSTTESVLLEIIRDDLHSKSYIVNDLIINRNLTNNNSNNNNIDKKN